MPKMFRWWPVGNCLRHVPAAASKRQTVVSSEPEAKEVPVSFHDSRLTQRVCPRSVAVCRSLPISDGCPPTFLRNPKLPPPARASALASLEYASPPDTLPPADAGTLPPRRSSRRWATFRGPAAKRSVLGRAERGDTRRGVVTAADLEVDNPACRRRLCRVEKSVFCWSRAGGWWGGARCFGGSDDGAASSSIAALVSCFFSVGIQEIWPKTSQRR